MSSDPNVRPAVPATMDHHERMRLRGAAIRAIRVYPGPIGEILSKELLGWEEFGYRLGSKGTIMGAVQAIMTTAIPGDTAAA